MQSLFQAGLSNAGIALFIAVVATALAPLLRRPSLVYGLWLLVLLKLVTPPLVNVPLPELMSPRHVASHRDMAPTVQEPAAPVISDTPHPTESVELPATAGQVASVFGSDPRPRVSWVHVLGGIWIAGSVAWFLLVSVRTARFMRRLRQAEPASVSLRRETARLARLLGLRRCPKLLVVDGRVPPFVWAVWGRAVVLLPAPLLERLDFSQQTAVIAHELAHLRRRDHWIRWLELVATGLYWWYPLVWWTRRQLQRNEEYLCDAWVLWSHPNDTKGYARALLTTIDFLSGAAVTVPAAASGFGPSRLLHRRVEMLVHRKTSRHLSRPARAAIFLAGALVLPLAMRTTPGLAVSDAAGATAPEPKAQQPAQAASPLQENAIAELEKLGGSIKRNETRPGKPVTVVSLSGPQITDAALAHLEQLKDLRELSLHGTAITDEGLVYLKGLSHLQSIVLNRTAVTDAGLSHLVGLTELRHVFLTATKISGEGLGHLSQLPKLEGLAIHYTNVDDDGLEHLEGLKKLTYLGLAGPSIGDSGLAHLKHLPKLEYLEIWSNQVTDDGLRHLAELKTLKTLGLSWCYKISDSGLAHLRGLPVEDLRLSDLKGVSDAGLVHLERLSHLQSLGLAGTGITAAGLGRLKPLPKLQHLGLSGTQLSDEAARQLKGLTSLRSLALSGSNIAEALKHVPQLDQLEGVSLHWRRGVRISDANLAPLKTSTHIQRLTLRGGVSDTALVGLKGLPGLRSLTLWNDGTENRLTDASLVHLGQLPRLRELVLRNTRISEDGMRNLRMALPGVTIKDRHPY